MKCTALVSAGLCVALAWPALAATTPQSNVGSGSSNNSAISANNESGTSAPRISQKLQRSLTQAGYTDVHIVPESFFIHAKDKNGNPVMMMVTPDSMTEVTAVKEPGGGASNKQASAAGSAGQSSVTQPSASPSATGKITKQ
jgi:hypothetical protein